MRTTTKRTLAAVTVAAAMAAILFAAGACARGSVGGPLERGAFWIDHLAEELELDDAQLRKIEAIAAQSKAQARPNVRKMMSLRKELRALMKADTFDEAAFRTALADKHGVMTELIVNRATRRFAIKTVLTPDQVEQLETLRPRQRLGH